MKRDEQNEVSNLSYSLFIFIKMRLSRPAAYLLFCDDRQLRTERRHDLVE